MRFSLTPEQRDFAASLRDLLSAAKTPGIVRAWASGDTEPGLGLLRQLADTGLAGLAVADRFGGLDAHPVDLVVAFLELGRAAVPGPVVETAAAVPTLLQALDDETAQRWLPGIADGTTLASFAAAPWTPRALDADVAGLVLMFDGDRLCTGRLIGQAASVDAARRLFTLEPDDVVAEGPAACAAVHRANNLAVLAVTAQLIGAGQSLLELATEYVKGRVQFGRPVGQFQAVKHHLADVAIALEMATPLLYGAALAIAADAPSAERDVSAAKVAGGDAAYLAARRALQVHGAIGYTAEYDLSLWLTKVQALRTAWGTPAVHRARVAEALRSVR